VYGSNQKGHKGGYKLFELETGKLVKEFWGRPHWRDHHTLQSDGKWYHPHGVLNLDPADFREFGEDYTSSKDKPRFPTPAEPKEPGLGFVGYLSPVLVDGHMLCRAPYRIICWDLREPEE
jgi:hypothetical protein